MDLSNLNKIKGIKRNAKRIGRGIGSGKGGHTVGRGNKGQKARKGHKISVGFEGGQVPLYKRLPQIGGFNSPSPRKVVILKVSILNAFKDEEKVTPELLLEKGFIKSLPKDGVKILSGGKLEKKLILSGFIYSEGAKKDITKSGSKIND